MAERQLLLDTCALVWLVAGSPRLSDGARAAIDRADVVAVSAISAWEVSLKVADGGLELPLAPLDWFESAVTHHGLSVAALSIDILVAANSLPWHHRDPADRFIVATAQQMSAVVVSADRCFAQYDIALMC